MKNKITQQKIEKYFNNVNQDSSKQKISVKEEQEKPESLVYYKKTDQTHLCLGARGYNIFHPQRYSQELLSIILGGNMSSRLFISIRERKGLAYHIRTYSEANLDTGYLVTQAGIDHKNINKVVGLILKEYKLLKNKSITEKELQKAKDYWKGALSLSLELSDSQAFFCANQELLEQKLETSEEKFKKIDQVSINDIKKIAEDIFQPEKLNLAIIGPFKDKTKFQSLLKI